MMQETTNEKDWTIRDIEALTEPEAQKMALETMTIKDHHVYMVFFPGSFGYSALVYADGRHIHYANDYALHHKGKTQEELRAWYLKSLPTKLFTEQEISEPVKSYDEYKRKEYFLRNYFPMRREYISAFYISHGSAAEDEARKQEIQGMILNPVGYAYYKPEDEDFVGRNIRLFMALKKAEKETLNSFEYQKAAFLYEMYNHEYGINWQADFDTLSAFGNLRPSHARDELGNYFKQLGFTALQRKAYLAARAQYLKEIEAADDAEYQAMKNA